MNYFALINRCLTELNYKEVSSFSNLTKADHAKIKNIINRVNIDICTADGWWFREQKTTMSITADTVEHTLSINGKITDVIVDSVSYYYDSNPESFYKEVSSGSTYGLYGNKILFTKQEAETATILYLTDYPAQSSAGVLKSEMSLTDDTSIIPEEFQESLLVYGACARFKAMPNNPKYQHWAAEYTRALANLRSKAKRSADEFPCFSVSQTKPRVISQYTFGDYNV